MKCNEKTKKKKEDVDKKYITEDDYEEDTRFYFSEISKTAFETGRKHDQDYVKKTTLSYGRMSPEITVVTVISCMSTLGRRTSRWSQYDNYHSTALSASAKIAKNKSSWF